MSTQADVSLAAMSAFVDGLVSGGVRRACVSPGSRSTPLALALARHPAIRVHVHLDERSSAFFALGLAKASAAPVVVACTSGTAAANLFPAVVEAAMVRAPLVVLTADRPPELRGVGANQTIDQLELFGRYVRSFADAPVPGNDPSPNAWHDRGATAVGSACGPPPGPVHRNLPFPEPLVPMPGQRVVASAVVPVPGGSAGARPDVRAGEAGVAELVAEVSDIDRGLVYAGGLRSGGRDVVALAERLGWPLVAEPHSGARLRGALEAGSLLLTSGSFVDAHLPDAVLQVGAAPTSRPAIALVGRTPRLLIIDPDEVVGDPLRRATRRVVAEPGSVLRAVEPGDGGAGRWAVAWRSASDRVRAVVDELLDGWDEPFEGRVARDVVDAAVDGSAICIGSSLPIRDADAFARPRDGVSVYANRGASGIDGFVSTALGVAASGVPTTALMGDLTLLHDVGALVWNAARGSDAVFVVLDNGGGRIFSLLEQRSLPELDELFTTPHRADLGAIVSATGARHTRVERAADLPHAIRRVSDTGGLAVVQVVIDADRDRARRAEIRRAVGEAVR
jgi:2-succinyl-5-enolpyruvyl-6-hydroxy-3-cyclohexene-1-carboxylate synthase